MPVTRVCPDCAEQWGQRDARFCGRCGAALAETARARPGSRGRPSLRVLAATGGAVVLLGAAAGIDLRLPDPDHAVVEVDDELTPADSPLTPEQTEALRAQADPNRLRCEPRGCEVWRIDRGSAGQEPFGDGIVALGDDLVLVLGGPLHTADVDPDGRVEERADYVVTAIDPQTGSQRWSTPVRGSTASDVDLHWARLAPGPDVAYLLAGPTISAIDGEGAVVWQWHAGGMSPDGAPDAQVWQAVPTPDVLLVQGVRPDGSGREDGSYLAALDLATGVPRWERDVVQVAHLDDQDVVTVDEAGLLRAVDPATGHVRWERSEVGMQEGSWLVGAGPWLWIQDPGATHTLLDPTTGRTVATLDGHLVGEASDERGWFVAVVADLAPWDEHHDGPGDGADMRVVAFDPAGQVAWTADLGMIDPWWMCCWLAIDGDTIAVNSERFQREYDRQSGELLSARPNDAPSSLPEWTPRPGMSVQWHEDGRGMRVRTDKGAVTIRSGRDLTIESWDPLVFGDHRHMLAVRVVGEG